MKKLYKLPPCSIYDVPAIEAWLIDLAQAGLLLQKTFRCLFIFQKEQPADRPWSCIYRLEPIPDYSKKPANDMLDDYASAGWEYVTALDKAFAIWRSVRPDADELHSDPLVQSTAYEQLCRRMSKNAAAAVLLPFAIFAIFLCGMLLTARPVTLFLASPSITLVIAAESACAIQAVRQMLTLHRLKQSLACGLTAVHYKDYKKKLWIWRCAQCCYLIPLLLIVSMPAFTFSLNWKKPLSKINTPLPYLPLELIEQDADISRNQALDAHRETDPYSCAEYAWTLFVPVHYDIYQQGSPHSIFKDPYNDTIAVLPSAKTEYFQLSLPFLAVPLYKEQLQSYTRRFHDPVITTLNHPGFDHAAIAYSDEYTQLFACRGNQVIHIQYWGTAGLSRLLDELSTAFDAVKSI